MMAASKGKTNCDIQINDESREVLRVCQGFQLNNRRSGRVLE